MSDKLGTYSFLPYLRSGIATKIEAPHVPGKIRATARVRIHIQGTRDGSPDLTDIFDRSIEVVGPGDIIGIDKRAIIKSEPHDGITNFEPNYLPYIEFYDEDFCWRYSPEGPDFDHHIRPWITLVVLRDDEFDDAQDAINTPLPFITITVQNPKTVFPPFDQIWAWAHVHVNRDIADKAEDIVVDFRDPGGISNELARLETLLKENPDLAYSRLLSPRKLAENTGYHAFVVPSFETGRLAGLGLDPADSPSAAHSAWCECDHGERPEPTRYPYYYRWHFRTGTKGDFEYLIRLLEPKPVDPRVGHRDMDVLEPGSNIPPIDKEELGGVLKLGGALRPVKIPKDVNSSTIHDDWDTDYPEPFQRKLAAFINLVDDYLNKTAQQAHHDASIPDPENPDDTADDPLIVPPMYGTWHALQKRLLKGAYGSPVVPDDKWIHKLNLDPRYRVAAAFGTKAVQTNQEEYMEAAWAQIGDVLEANRRIRRSQLAYIVANSWYKRYVIPLSRINPEGALLFLSPILKRVTMDGKTAYYHMKNSPVPFVAFSSAMRRILRPGGRLNRQSLYEPGDVRINPDTLITRINDGEVSHVRPKAPLTGTVTLEEFLEQLASEGAL